MKTSWEQVQSLKNHTLDYPHTLHIVMGNVSCDMDSVTTAILRGLFLQQQLNDPAQFVIPILNATQAEMQSRFDIVAHFKHFDIDLS